MRDPRTTWTQVSLRGEIRHADLSIKAFMYTPDAIGYLDRVLFTICL